MKTKVFNFVTHDLSDSNISKNSRHVYAMKNFFSLLINVISIKRYIFTVRPFFLHHASDWYYNWINVQPISPEMKQKAEG